MPAEAIPISTGPLPALLAWWIGYFGMSTGAYLIFLCERSDPPLIGYGVLSALLGVAVYATVRFPDWLPGIFSRWALVSISLILLFGMIIHFTWLIWQHYRLKPPWVRICELVCEEFLRVCEFVREKLQERDHDHDRDRAEDP